MNDNISTLQEQLAAYRHKITELLNQTSLTNADLTTIREARAGIAQCKAALRAAGVAVKDAPEDEETAQGAGVQGRVEVPGNVEGNVIGVNLGSVSYQSGDQVAGDKIVGDKVMGDKHDHHFYPAQPQPRDGPRFSIPYPSLSEGLVGRDELLAELQAKLCVSTPVRLALAGMPGAGKTSVALTLAYDAQIREHFSGGVLMASLGQTPDLINVTRRWGSDLGLQITPQSTFEEQLQQITGLINRAAQPFLIVIDDVWNINHARPFLLASPHVSALFTGRQRDALQSVDFGDLVGSGNIITIPQLDTAQAVDLLRRSAELPASAYQSELETLAALVGGLPLLLEAMGRYLRDQRQQHQERWFQVALDELHSAARRLNLPTTSITQAQKSQRGGMFARFFNKPITSLNARVIIAMSFAALPRQAQDAFVRLAALPPEPLTFGADSARITAEATDDTLRLLVRRSLLTEASDGRFRLHRVLWDWAESHDARAIRQAQRVLADWHADLSKEEYAEEFGEWRKNPDNWQHMLKTWRDAVEIPDALQGAIRTILPLLIDQGYARDVLPGLIKALEMFRKVDRFFAARIRYYLGMAHYRLAEYQLARNYAAIALDDFQKSLSTSAQAMVLSLIGHIEKATGHYNTAKQCYQEALQLTPETDERNYAACLNDLADLYRAQGEYGSARPLLERAVSIYEQALGPNHPDTATSLNNLAALHYSQGEYGAARPLYERALAIREQALGPNHPDTASSLNNLAALHYSQGEYGAARPLYERALAIREQALGPMHPHTAQSLNNLAALLRAQGEYGAARPLYERALAIYEQALGPNHPDTAQSLNNLAALLRAQGEYGAARPLYERALAIYEQALGPNHPDTATSLNNLAGLHYAQGEYGAARPLLERALTICEGSLGVDHPTTRIVRGNLAELNAQSSSSAEDDGLDGPDKVTG